MTIVTCPTCKKSVEWLPTQKWRPFCSERCHLIDLGKWADGTYAIPAVEEEPLTDESNQH